MGHYLNFGPGPNILPEPWQNLEPNHDIRKRLRFGDGTCSQILAEHVIEHVSFLQGYQFLGEVLRILEPGGILRLAFPDISRMLSSWWATADVSRVPKNYSLSSTALNYAKALAKKPDGAWSAGLSDADLSRHAMLRMLTGWGHQMAWTHESAAGVLLSIGFSKVVQQPYNKGRIAGVDGHHRDVGPELAEVESTVLEATK
jgi:hypothetical protein